MANGTPDKTLARKARLVSLDTLRGFDMFWIIGARALASGLANLHLPGVSALAAQLTHSAWNGFTFYDLIFPLFIFITGVSLVLSLQKRIERGDDKRVILRHVLTRTVTLFLLGVVYNGFNLGGPAGVSVRLMGVLQRSALCYLAAALLVLYTKPRVQAATVVGLLAGYWAVMRFVPVPGFGAGVWTVEGNLAHYLDRLLLPGRLYFGDWDPEGLLTTVPAIATCLLGALTAHWLRAESRSKLSPERRTLYLFLGGVALAGLGLLLSPVFPINKKLWTSSFVLLTGGLAVMLLSVFHWVIDLRGRKRWAFPFVVVGMNSLFIYLAARFIPFDRLAHWIASASLFAFLGRGQTLFIALAQLTIEGALLLWMYARRTFVRI
ncbi:MAG: acyltransferase family protein [Chitinophagales bacterium]